MKLLIISFSINAIHGLPSTLKDRIFQHGNGNKYKRHVCVV